MKITRKVIQDLLPLYLAGEVSDDTRMLVEKYLETDPELVELVNQNKPLDLNGELAVSRSEENALKTYKKSRSMVVLFIVLLAGIMACTLIATLYAFFTPA